MQRWSVVKDNFLASEYVVKNELLVFLRGTLGTRSDSLQFPFLVEMPHHRPRYEQVRECGLSCQPLKPEKPRID